MSERQTKEQQLRELDDRLNRGWDVIDAAPDAATRDHYEAFWFALLQRYEQLADELRVARSLRKVA